VRQIVAPFLQIALEPANENKPAALKAAVIGELSSENSIAYTRLIDWESGASSSTFQVRQGLGFMRFCRMIARDWIVLFKKLIRQSSTLINRKQWSRPDALWSGV
jgi:hypothetical protein